MPGQSTFISVAPLPEIAPEHSVKHRSVRKKKARYMLPNLIGHARQRNGGSLPAFQGGKKAEFRDSARQTRRVKASRLKILFFLLFLKPELAPLNLVSRSSTLLNTASRTATA